jgi:hypothetical protein
MKAIDLIRFAMTMANEGTLRLADELKDVPLKQPTSAGGNHPMWVLGHLAWVEGSLQNILVGAPNPVAHWEPMFGIGSQPTRNAADYPPYEEVVNTYRDLRAKNLGRLEEIGEAGLDQKPANIPPGFEDFMATFGQTMLTLALHQAGHTGQLTVVKRAAGKKPMM